MHPVCLVTGASGGLGAALAREFAKAGYSLVLSGRREAQLAALGEEITALGHAQPTTITADLGMADGPANLAAALTARHLEPAILVNSAGFGLLGEAGQLDLSLQLAMIDLNVRALTDLSLRFLDSVARHQGGILNVASTAGFLPGHGMAVYHATKAYVISLTEALHAELAGKGVRVCALCPGPVDTEFFGHAGVPPGYFPSYLTREANRVAREAYQGFVGGHRVVVPGRANRLMSLLPRVMPRGLVLALTARRWRRADHRS
jgi:short-subunit dehydrogenase